VGFEPTIPASAWLQAYALDCAATGIGLAYFNAVGNSKGRKDGHKYKASIGMEMSRITRSSTGFRYKGLLVLCNFHFQYNFQAQEFGNFFYNETVKIKVNTIQTISMVIREMSGKKHNIQR
jgi:hypothetical protein